jgi:LysM repeat protein
MNLRKTIFAVLLTMLFGMQAGAQEYFMHTVTQGQGLYSISRMYGVTEDDIIKLNPGSEKVIRAGEQLRIPNRKPSTGRFHTIQKGETLYRLSVENRISVKELCDANPGLSAENFKIGQVITIPAPSDEDPLESTLEHAGDNTPQEIKTDIQTIRSDTAKYKTTHVVQRRETIFRICRNYDISQAEFLEANPQYKYTKLRQGAVVNIPFSQKEIDERNRRLSDARNRMESISDSTLFLMNEPKADEQDDGVLTAALILPFSLGDSTSTLQKQMVEFYQGMLLALDRLKNEGVSVNLRIYDSEGEDNSLTPLLESGKLDDVDIIFGPRWTRQIAEVARWASARQIPVVNPMNRDADDVYNNPYVYQLNTPQSYFNQEIYNHFLEKFTNPNVIILDADEYRRNEFLDGFKLVLSDHDIPVTTLMVDTAYQALLDTIVPDKQNIFILNTNSSEPLNTMLPVLQLITRTKAPEVETHLFGYPEYQIYAQDHLEEFYEVDTWFYSWFYTNNMLQESVEFNNLFRRSFSRQMMVSYPSFAPYGYDTGYYFLKALSLYGKDLENHLDEIETNPVHTGFKFERANNWGGFINRKVFFIHFSNDYKVEKIDFDK